MSRYSYDDNDDDGKVTGMMVLPIGFLVGMLIILLGF
jgi:hypothetical protein